MISLKTYLSNNQQSNIIDGHIHLFDHLNVINDYIPLSNNTTYVGFMDVDFTKLELYDNESVIKYYDNYINNYYSINIYLLATATDSQTMIDLYNKYPNIIKGFGEIKCYSYFNNSVTNKRELLYFDNLKWIYPLCEFNKDLKLPIYIHWINNSNERINELILCLEKYPTIPFVLCHCGMSKNIPYKLLYNTIIKLLLKYNNLFVDISYNALTFFNNNIEYLQPLKNKYIIGSDISPKMCINKNQKQYINNFNNIIKYANYKNTFNTIFK